MLLRTLTILAALVPFLVSFLRDRRRYLLIGSPRVLGRKEHLARAERMRRTAGRLGPTFIKLAQILGARADFLPEVYVEQFAMLHDKVPPIEAERIKDVIESELGRPVEQIFSAFDDEPVAAASLGQVHVAWRDGQKVVVKVIRPGVRRVVGQDLRIMRRILRTLDAVMQGPFIPTMITTVEEFSRIIAEEMDLRIEARNAETFRGNFADNPALIIPEIDHDLTTRSVIVLRHYDGTKVTSIEDPTPDHARVRGIISHLIEIYARQVLVDGFFHADPHPGNILIRDDGRIVLLDFGMVIRLSELTRHRLLRAATAWARKDVDALIESLYDLGVIEPEINFAVITEAARELIDVLDRNRFTQQRVRKICSEILDTFYRFPLRLPPNIVYLFKTAILIDGLGVRFDPTFDGTRAASPVIRRMMAGALPDARQSPADYLKGFAGDWMRFAGEARRVMAKAAREELRIRAHERDILRIEAFVASIARRIIASLSALSMVVIAGIIYHKTGNIWVLLGCLGAVAVFMVTVLLLPIKPHGRFQGKG